jgi:hypothetical protein
MQSHLGALKPKVYRGEIEGWWDTIKPPSGLKEAIPQLTDILPPSNRKHGLEDDVSSE